MNRNNVPKIKKGTLLRFSALPYLRIKNRKIKKVRSCASALFLISGTKSAKAQLHT